MEKSLVYRGLTEAMQRQALAPICKETKKAGHASAAANQSASLIGLDVWKREPNKGTVQLKSLARVALHGWRETACRPQRTNQPLTRLFLFISQKTYCQITIWCNLVLPSFQKKVILEFKICP